MISDSEFLVRPADRSHEAPSAASSPERKNQRRKRRRRSKTRPEAGKRPSEPVADEDGTPGRPGIDSDEDSDGVDYYA